MRQAIIVLALIGLVCTLASAAFFLMSGSFTSPRWGIGLILLTPGMLCGFAACILSLLHILLRALRPLITTLKAVRSGTLTSQVVPEARPMAISRLGVMWTLAMFAVILVTIGVFQGVAQPHTNSPIVGFYVALLAAIFPLGGLVYGLASKEGAMAQNDEKN